MKTTSRNHKVEIVAISAIEHYKRNARKHSKKQIGKIAQSIKKFGWTVPLLIDGDGNLIAGHGRLEAVKLLGLKKFRLFASPISAKNRSWRCALQTTALLRKQTGMKIYWRPNSRH
jgi:ParB-like chromosome segregation protein Spo0J